MAALDPGPGCDGLAFRVREAEIETETELLFRREMIGPGYLPILHPVQIGEASVTALVFVADHAEPVILAEISRARQLRYIATGTGILGSSRDYLASIVDHFRQIGMEDPHCSALLREVDALIAARSGEPATL